MQELKPALQYSQGRSKAWSGAIIVNCFAEKADGDKREDFALLVTPGLTEWATIGSGPIRGGIELNGVTYVVSGTELYSVDVDGVPTLIGTIEGGGPVRMATNYTQLAIAAAPHGYVLSEGFLTEPTDYDVSDVTYVDGYMLWTVQNAEQFFISAINNALLYDPLDISSVEGSPDNIVAVVNNHREVTFLNGASIEFYYNSGNSDFPFERQGNAFVEQGCFDRDSVIKLDNGLTFVGDDRIVYSMYGYQPQRISTHAIERFLKDATYARATSYTMEGHKFYCLEVDGGAFLFDHATGTWHQRKSRDMDYWRVGTAFESYGRTIFGDRVTGQLFIPSPDVYSEDGEPIEVDIYLPVIEAGRGLKSMRSFEAICEMGVGNGASADPQIMLRYSDSNGHLWSNEMWRGLGQTGQYKRRAIWRKLGQFRQRQMHLRITDAAYRIVIAYWADIQ